MIMWLSYSILLILRFLDVNECLVATDNNCAQLCINTNGSFHCQCNSGYILSSDNSTCNGWLTWLTHTVFHINYFPDVNECLIATDNNCSQLCINTNGSFHCQCNSGYVLSSDDTTCNGWQIWPPHTVFHINYFLDVNECLVGNANNCSQLCINTNGSFHCQCNSGYILSSDNLTCNGWLTWLPHTVFHISYFPDVNECLFATDNNCSQLCINTNGSFHCQCNSGYILSSDNSTCNGWLISPPHTVFHFNYFPDVNECLISTNNNCSQLCFNTNGSFRCQCNSGYILASDNSTCNGWLIWPPHTVFHINYFPDVNECLIATDNNCSQLCINTNGSFHCQCNSGYILSSDNSTCNGWLTWLPILYFISPIFQT